MLQGEMNAPRIIDLTGKTTLPGLPRWLGESEAHWDSDALIAHTSNFRPEGSWDFFKFSSELRVKERLELIDRNEIKYRYTVDDPVIYSAPFTVEMSITRRPADERLYEFACHEANYSLEGIMRGARVAEQQGASIEE